MADLGQYNNYTTYPGFGPWTRTNYEQDLTEDYRIEDSNLPSESIATRLDIFSSSYTFSDYLGPIIPLPSAILANINALIIINLRCSYWNWFNTGFSLNTISAGTSGGYSIPRPPTFHHQIGKKYKEVVHYGFNMILPTLISGTGTAQVISVEGFFPYLEHRSQAEMIRFILQDGVIQSYDFSGDNLTITPVYEDIVFAAELDNLDIEMTIFLPIINNGEQEFTQYEEATINISGITEDGKLISKVSSIDSELLSKITGSPTVNLDIPPEDRISLNSLYFMMNKSIQLEDPAILYSEIKTDDKYIKEGDRGFETREQQVVATASTWTSVFYDASLISQRLNIKAKQSKSTADNSEDTEEVKAAQEDYERYTNEIAAVESKSEVYEGLSEAVNGEDISGVNLAAVVLREYEETQTQTIHLRVPIDGGISTKNNFHAGTQDGNYMLSTINDSISAFRILEHKRNEIFLLSNSSITSTLSLYDALNKFSEHNFEIRSYNMWRFIDITTNSAGGTTNNNFLDRGIFLGTINNVEKHNEDTPTIGKITYKFSDRNYYRFNYLTERFVNDYPSVSDNVIDAWIKFNGWRLHRLNDERNTSYEIFSVTSIEDGVWELTIDGVDDFELGVEIDGEWWIGFADIFPNKGTLNYIGSPFLGLNAVTAGETLSLQTLQFDGIYVGSPLDGLGLQQEQVVSLVEDFPALFPNTGNGNSVIKVSTIKAFKYVAYSEDINTDSEFILHQRDDDVSNALYVRQGRIDFMYDIDEYLAYIGDSFIVDASVTISGDVQIAQSDSFVEKDIISVNVKKKSPETHPKIKEGEYENTLWRVYHGDRLLGFAATSEKEFTIFTRGAGLDGSQIASEIPLYRTSENFTRGKEVRYITPGNTLTGDSSVGSGNVIRFVPVLNSNDEALFEAKFELVSNSQVIRNAKSPYVTPHVGGQRLIMVVLAQDFYLPGGTISSFAVIEGTEDSKNEEKNTSLPSLTYGSTSMDEEGLFLMSTTDQFESFVSSIFSKPSPFASDKLRNNLYRYPYLLIPNITECSYYKNGPILEVVGFTKFNDDGNEVLALTWYEVNLDAVFRNPVFAFLTDSEDILFLTSNIISDITPVIGNTSTENIKPGLINENLSISPLGYAVDNQKRLLVIENVNEFWFAISTSGKTWSYYSDISLVNEIRPVAAPVIKIYDNWVYIFYILDKLELKFKRVPFSSISKFHKRYIENVSSSSEENDDVNNIKQELQEELDNMESVTIVETFEQQVSFTINNRGNLHVVYYDENGRIRSAQSTTEGLEWEIAPINF